jgi:hypothetical protein
MMENPSPMSAEVSENDIPSTILALKHLVQAPDVYDGDTFQRYPGMKLGYGPDVDFFAEKLCELAMRAVAPDAGADAWMLTAPAYHHLPSAANLLAERLHAMLRHRGVVWPLVELRLLPEQVAVHSLEEFRRSYEYSRSPVTQRVAERKRLHDTTRLNPDWQRFAGRRVMVVNDIHVTGTQQRFMHSSLAAAGATACLWLYIFHVDGELARTYPEVEHRINSCNLADLRRRAIRRAACRDCSTKISIIFATWCSPYLRNRANASITQRCARDVTTPPCSLKRCAY